MTWTPPIDDPAQMNANSYRHTLQPYIKYERPRFDPGSRENYDGFQSYWRFFLLAAGHKADGNRSDRERGSRALQRFRIGLAANKATALARYRVEKRPSELAGEYLFGDLFANLITAARVFSSDPEYPRILSFLGDTLVDHFEELPIYWEGGAMNRPWSVAFQYDLALAYGRPTYREPQWREYADAIWSFWYGLRDFDEDAERYSLVDLTILREWPALRGVEWRSDRALVDLWCHYADLITNDGMYVSYGDSGTNGDFMMGVHIAEVAAAASRDGRYKWLAHRAFWNGRDRLARLEEFNHTQRGQLALAYIEADESVAESAPIASTTLSYRRPRERSQWSQPQADRAYWYINETPRPSKIVFRSGGRTDCATMVVQAGNQAGHGHPDAGAIIHYSGRFSTFLCNGVSRLDLKMQHHNLVRLGFVDSDRPWSAHIESSEHTSVPIASQVGPCGYARLRVGPHQRATVNRAAWNALQAWSGGWSSAFRLSIGYKNWPLTLDRAILMGGDDYAVVRDTLTFALSVKEAIVGQNWVIGDVVAEDPAGTWLAHHVPTMSNDEYMGHPIVPIETGPDALFIWMSATASDPITTSPLPVTLFFPGTDRPVYRQNLRTSAWRPTAGSWRAGERHSMTSVLIPCSGEGSGLPRVGVEMENGSSVVLKIQTGEAERWVFLGNPTGDLQAGFLRLSAEAAVLTRTTRGSVELTAWSLTSLSVKNIQLWPSKNSTSPFSKAPVKPGPISGRAEFDLPLPW